MSFDPERPQSESPKDQLAKLAQKYADEHHSIPEIVEQYFGKDYADDFRERYSQNPTAFFEGITALLESSEVVTREQIETITENFIEMTNSTLDTLSQEGRETIALTREKFNRIMDESNEE